MQTSQTKINQEVAIALERLNGRMESFEGWRKEVDDERRRQDELRDNRIEKQPDNRRADMALVVAVFTAVIYLATFVAAHWRP